MLKRLYIKNLVLVSSLELSFDAGFTVLTGESGVGKSVVLSALTLVLGQKQESSLIRQGESEAIIEASFDDVPSTVYDFLEDAGIMRDDDGVLIIKRILSAMGKSKTFVNNQAATSGLLKKIAPYLIRFSAQHAHIALFDQDLQQYFLDTFANLLQEKEQYQKILAELSTIIDEIDTLEKQDIAALIEASAQEIAVLDDAQVESTEDDELFSEYSSLMLLQNQKAELHVLYESFDAGILPEILAKRSAFDKLFQSQEALRTLYTTITNDCKELCYELASWVKKSDVDEGRLYEIEARLNEIDALKKKFKCTTCTELLEQQEQKKQLLIQYHASERRTESLQQKKVLLETELDRIGQILSDKRKKAASVFSKEVSDYLVELAMPHAVFEVALSNTPRTKHGNETACFYLTANKGFSKGKLSETASGGELSRIFLAITCCMIEKESQTFLVFDEIDANVGGKTAAVIGEKLKMLGSKHQVLAITHFPQVAKCAHHHIQLTKEETNNSAYTQAIALTDEGMKNSEYLRMVGV